VRGLRAVASAASRGGFADARQRAGRVLAIESHHLLHEVVLAKRLHLPQLVDDGGIEQDCFVRGSRRRGLVIARGRLAAALVVGLAGGQVGTQLLDDAGKLSDGERLVQDVVHAGFAPGIRSRAYHVRGQRHDRHARLLQPRLGGADVAGRFEPVHLGHAAVHEHDVEASLGQRRNGLNAIVDGLDRSAQLRQGLARHFAIDRIVVGYERRERPERRGGGCFARRARWPQIGFAARQAPEQILDFRAQQWPRDGRIGSAGAHQVIGRRIAELADGNHQRALPLARQREARQPLGIGTDQCRAHPVLARKAVVVRHDRVP
jgi:hypothetical protein